MADLRTVAAHLQILINSPEWDYYEQELTQIIDGSTEDLVTLKQDIAFAQGYICGLRKARHIPKQIIAQVKGS